MNRIFKLEQSQSDTGTPAVKLLVRTLPNPFREIKRTIILYNDEMYFNDDLIRADWFDWSNDDYRESVAAHMLNELISKPVSPESLAAWYFVIELSSWLLAISRLMKEATFRIQEEGHAELQETEIRNALSAEATTENWQRRLPSENPIESFLAGERRNNPSGFSTTRNHVQLAIKKYLGDELNFLPQHVGSVASDIESIDGSVLDDHVESVRRNPNQFVKEWFNYFANLRTGSLRLFSPAPSELKPSKNEEVILTKLTREHPVLKAYNASTLPEAAFAYLADFIRSGFFEEVTGIPEEEIDTYIFDRERAQAVHFICSDDETGESYTVLNDMSLYMHSAEGCTVLPFAMDYLNERVLKADPSSLSKCDKELLQYFGLPRSRRTEHGSS